MTPEHVQLWATAPARGEPAGIERDPDMLGPYVEDASGRAPGRAVGLVRPVSAAEASAWLAATARDGSTVLPQAARSSLTGGAVPDGDVVLSVERLRDVGPIEASGGSARVRVGSGVRLRELQETLAERGWYFPPVPTYQEAMVGGVVSTNAGGAATFKYGTTRKWVRGLTIALADGHVVELERGQLQVRAGGRIEIRRESGAVTACDAPDWPLPAVPKLSAGYHSADPLDLVDLFVGAEGTLGVVLDATLDLEPLPAAVLTAVAFPASIASAYALAATLRDRAIAVRGSGGGAGPDVRAIEIVDDRGLALLRGHGDASRLRVEIPGEARAAILIEAELPAPCSTARAVDELESWIAGNPPPDPGALGDALRSLFEVLDRHEVVDSLQVAFPDDPPRRDALVAFREAVPTRVNEILAGRRQSDPGVRKVGGDLIVPFEAVPEMLAGYAAEFERRGLEFAIWGHLSDGNLHPNALARSAAEVASAERALLRFADLAIGLGGSPLSEHGVGRSTLKQAMLRRFLGDDAIERMRAIRAAFDPGGRLAPGVLLPAPV